MKTFSLSNITLTIRIGQLINTSTLQVLGFFKFHIIFFFLQIYKIKRKSKVKGKKKSKKKLKNEKFMGKGSPQPWTQNRGGWVGTGKATGKQKAKYRNERIFRLNFKRSIIRRYKHSVLY